MQQHPHCERDENEGDEAVGHAVGAPRGQPFERRKALTERKPCRSVVGVIAGDPAIQQQAAERDHEGLQAHLRDQHAIDPSDQRPRNKGDQHGQGPGQLQRHDEIDEDHAQQREHRADREIDAAGDDHKAFAEREQPEKTDQIGGVGHVDRGQKARVDQRDDGADHEDEDEEAQIFFQHGKSFFNIGSFLNIRSFFSMSVPDS